MKIMNHNSYIMPTKTIMECAREFVDAYNKYSGKPPAVYRGKFVRQMVDDESEELVEALKNGSVDDAGGCHH